MNANKFLLLALLLCSISFLSAQEDAKYLAGAVPEVNGKVVFEREIKTDPSVSIDKLLQLTEDWAREEFEAEDKKYEGANQRILLTSKEDHYLVVQGDEKLVFKSQLLMIDQTIITYHLIVRVVLGKCTLTMRNIKYEYQDYDEPMPAEEMIIDKIALHKSGEKLNRHYDKFRRFTIDRVDAIADSFRTYLGKISPSEVKEVKKEETIVISEPQEIMQQKKISAAPIVMDGKTVTFAAAGYKSMSAEDLSDDIMEMFKDNWVLVTRGSGDNVKVFPAVWSGKGNFGSKPVVMSVVKGGEDNADTYTISFYTQIHKKALDKIANGGSNDLTPIASPTGGTAYSEAWMIIECKKVLEQPATSEMVKDAQSKMWNNIQGFDKLLMGEIVNIWVR